MRFHWQNLNEKPGSRTGSPLRHGRAWLTVVMPGGRPWKVNWEWVLGGLSCHASVGLSRGEDQGAKLSLSVPLLGALYLTLAGGPMAWLARRLVPDWTFDDHDDRQVSVRVHDWAIWWSVWRSPMASWSRKVPRWREGSWHPLDTFLGRTKYGSREVEVADVDVPMPEGAYRWRVTISEDSWKRPRWPLALLRLRAHAEAQEGEQVPVPGKGTESYNCGEDAIFSLTTPARSVAEAVGKVVESATRSRRRYGGADWRPEPRLPEGPARPLRGRT